MVLLVEKLSRSLKFPSRQENHRHLKSDASSASLRNFRSAISEFIAGIMVEPELMSVAGFNKCFELINTCNRGFAELVIDIDYPMRQWGPNLTDAYLSCTLHLLGLSNAVTSAAARLSQVKMSILHALALINRSPPMASRHLSIISPGVGEMFKFERAIEMRGRPPSSQQEQVLTQALGLSKNIGFLALGFVVSGLCGDDQPYMEMRKNAGVFEFDDPLCKDVDSRFYRELQLQGGIGMVEVREVNASTERLQSAIISNTGRCTQPVEDLKTRLKLLENSIHGVENQANQLFSQVLSARNKLLGNIRIPE